MSRIWTKGSKKRKKVLTLLPCDIGNWGSNWTAHVTGTWVEEQATVSKKCWLLYRNFIPRWIQNSITTCNLSLALLEIHGISLNIRTWSWTFSVSSKLLSSLCCGGRMNKRATPSCGGICSPPLAPFYPSHAVCQETRTKENLIIKEFKLLSAATFMWNLRHSCTDKLLFCTLMHTGNTPCN